MTTPGAEVVDAPRETPVDPASDPALAAYYGQVLQWITCRGKFECSWLTVPTSYEDPSLGAVKVRILRDASAKPGRRIGSLIVNPGGPGGSGTELAQYANYYFSRDLRNHFDVVGFDPRGITQSTPAVECMDNDQFEAWIDADPTPDTAAERLVLIDASRTFAEGCERRSPVISHHMDTRLVARDLDVLRAALGEPRLNYLGYSYGTQIGAMYLDLFPTRAGRLVLDGAIDPSLDFVETIHGQAIGFNRALRQFAKDCLTHADCPLPAPASRALDRIERFLNDLDARPIRAQAGRPLLLAQAVNAVFSALYDDYSGWPLLREGLAAGLSGNGRPLQRMADLYTGRRADGVYTGNEFYAGYYAVSCWDAPRPTGPRGLRDLARAWGSRAAVPEIAESLAWSILPCHYWAGNSTVLPHEVTAPGAPPVLVIGTRFDPATPVEWAKALASQLESGVFVEWVGNGHVAYGRGSACIVTAVDRYLLTGTPPRDGKVCR
ncbi:MAG: alpha/beta hydrolase [Actinomycetota bacterium]|nr:alpha/beta hydrolase [Actinomycetota bacterium]